MRRNEIGIGLAGLVLAGAAGFGVAKLTESPSSNQGIRNGSAEASATPKPSAAAGSAAPEANPTAAPKPSAAAESGSPLGCDVLAVTNLTERPGAVVNGTRVELEVRDKNQCARPLFYNETGVAKGQNYKLALPKGWTALIASLSAEVQEPNKEAKQYTNTPFLRVDGPFDGGVGVYEGAIRVEPTEWAQAITDQALPIQRAQTHKPDLQVTVYGK